MGQKVINGDLNVIGNVMQNNASLYDTIKSDVFIDLENKGAIFLQHLDATGITAAELDGIMAVVTGQSDESFEAHPDNDHWTEIQYWCMIGFPLHVGNDMPFLFRPFGMQYIMTNVANTTWEGVTLVPFVIILDPTNQKLIAYPWDKFFGSGSAGTGDVSIFDASVRLNIPESNHYVKVTTRCIANEDDFLASFNEILADLQAPTMTSIDDFGTVMQSIYDATYATDPTTIIGLACFLATAVEFPVFVNAYYEYQDANSAEPEVHLLIKTNYTGHAKFIDDTGTTVDLQTDLATRLANGYTLDSTLTKIQKTTIMQGGGAGGSTELKMPCKKIVISSSDETGSGTDAIENAKFEFVLTKEMLDNVLTVMSARTQTEITEDNLPTVWSTLDRVVRSGFAARLHGMVGTNPLCSDFIVGDFGDLSDVPFQINSPIDDAGADAVRFDLDEGITVEFFATSTSGDTLAIEDVEFDLGAKVAAGSDGGSGKLYVLDFDLSTKVPSDSSYGNAGDIISASQHYQMCFYESNWERVKATLASVGHSEIQTVQDLVDGFNGLDGTATMSGAFEAYALFNDLVALCDNLYIVTERLNTPFYYKMVFATEPSAMAHGLGLSPDSVVTALGQAYGSAGGNLDEDPLALDFNNSCTVTEYGTSASSGTSNDDSSNSSVTFGKVYFPSAGSSMLAVQYLDGTVDYPVLDNNECYIQTTKPFRILWNPHNYGLILNPILKYHSSNGDCIQMNDDSAHVYYLTGTDTNAVLLSVATYTLIGCDMHLYYTDSGVD